MITVPAHRVKQFGVEFFQASFSAKDIERLVKFEVLGYAGADAPAGTVSIAGDFNNWQPAPMEREGGDWIVRLPLSPGVYHYAFRAASGDWFVPPSTPGRRDDGMGGFVAVLVVS